MTKDELETILENQDWKLEEMYNNEKELVITISSMSDAGEDLYETIYVQPDDTLSHAFYVWAESFDPEEHVKMWLDAKEHGTQGVPDLFTLVEDAKSIEEAFENLAREIADAEK